MMPKILYALAVAATVYLGLFVSFEAGAWLGVVILLIAVLSLVAHPTNTEAPKPKHRGFTAKGEHESDDTIF